MALDVMKVPVAYAAKLERCFEKRRAVLRSRYSIPGLPW